MTDQAEDPPVAVTATGPVRGLKQDGVLRFLGVPYAAAPVGERRFKAPEPHPGWTEPRDATAFGPNAPQRLRAFPAMDVAPIIGDGWAPGDDYLNLNVWTADVGGRAPVIVFIHGGAFVAVSNRASAYDGTAFARSGVVLVSINYRMGIEGFLPIEGAPTNLGLRDMLAALAWVRDNVAAFGGDPANVMVMGESAGAMAIAGLVTSPLATGLFRRAIVQSGHGSMVRSLPVAKRLTAKMASLLGVAATVEGFRGVSDEQGLDALEQVQLPTAKIDLRETNGRDPSYGLSRFLPVHGDDVLPEPPLLALARGAGKDVELLIGTNAEEMNIYFVPANLKAKLNWPLAWFALGRVESRPLRALRAYAGTGMRAGEAFTRVLHDLVFRLPARKFAAAHQGRTHVYEFGWRSTQFDGRLGACHGLELPFVFNTLATCTGERGLAGANPPQDLADSVHRLWVDYARSGALPWPEYDAAGRQVYALERGEAAREPQMPAERFWA